MVDVSTTHVRRSLPSDRDDPVTRRRFVLAALRWLFIALVVGVITWQVVRQWDAVRSAVAEIGPSGVLGSLAATVVGLGATCVAWRVLLAGLGSPLKLAPAAGIFFVAQLGKYLPGSVWPYLAQARLGRAHGVPVARSAAAGALFVLLHAATGAVVAALTLPLVGDETIARQFSWLPWLVPLLVVAVHPRVVHRGLGAVYRLSRRGSPPPVLPWSTLGGALGALAIAWVAYGAALFLLVAPLSGGSWRAAILSTGGFALAWTVGFVAAAVLVVAAPAGLGVRELALYGVLAPLVSGAGATAVVVLSRIGQLAGDVLWAVAAALWSRTVRAGETAASDRRAGSSAPDGSDGRERRADAGAGEAAGLRTEISPTPRPRGPGQASDSP